MDNGQLTIGSMTPIPILVLGSILVVSFVSFIGVLFLPLGEERTKKFLLYFVSFSTGGLLGDVFIHMLPELMEVPEVASRGIPLVLVGIVLSFVIEKFIHWRHCHVYPLDDHVHVHPVGMMNLLGDAVHNFIDGILIAGSFLVSLPVGIATTVAVILHEIPQEIGDFAVLLHAGYAKARALRFNFLSALGALLGGILILLGGWSSESIGAWLLPLAAGNFLYIAGADLIPELHKETSPRSSFLQLLCMIAGIAVMYGLRFIE